MTTWLYLLSEKVGGGEGGGTGAAQRFIHPDRSSDDESGARRYERTGRCREREGTEERARLLVATAR